MKKKITRLSIDGLRKEMPVLSIEEESEVIGGGTVYYLDSSGRCWSTGFISGNDDCIDINGNRLTIPGSLNVQVSSNGLRINGNGVGQELEIFINRNTNVEWVFSCNRNDPYNNCALNTSYLEDHVYYKPYLGYDTHVQTHPYNNTPSNEDKAAKEKLQNMGYEYFYIHYNGVYYPF